VESYFENKKNKSQKKEIQIPKLTAVQAEIEERQDVETIEDGFTNQTLTGTTPSYMNTALFSIRDLSNLESVIDRNLEN